MNGQGRPQRGAGARRGLLLAAICCCALTFCPAFSQAAETTWRLRLAWGGENKAWEGSLQLSAGEILSIVPLSLEADAPGSILKIDAQSARILRRIPRSYDGCDLTIQADEQATLHVQLAADGKPPRKFDVPLAKALRGLQTIPLDEAGNRLLVQRAPGEALQVELDRDMLVLQPLEKWTVKVQPRLLDPPLNATLTLQVHVTAARTEQEVASFTREIKFDGQGNAAAETLELDAPAGEGAYDVRLSLHKKGFGAGLPSQLQPTIPSSLAPVLGRSKGIAERRVQFVVLSATQPTGTAAAWQTEFELDPASPRWWERLPRLPTFKMLPSFTTGPIGNAKPEFKSYLGTTLVEIPADSWQAYPLSTAHPGEPHILEIEYPSDMPQALAMSVIEPNAAGQVTPLGVDSGIIVPEPGPGHTPRIERHRLVIWPQTRTTLVLLANRRSDRGAQYGKIRLMQGPSEMEALALPDAGPQRRRLTAYFDKPLIAEAFSGDEALDPITKRTLDDWVTFQRSGRRLVEYLRYAGYQSAIVPALCEGNLLYPSQATESAPNYESGVFFETGQDPLRKDVLELYFRLFNRAGLELAPAFHFATPLPELEKLRFGDPAAAVGIEPVGSDGRPWTARFGTRRGSGAYYNPLDPRVQDAMRRVVREVIDRYGHHPSFAGVCVNLGPETYTQLPDDSVSVDDATIARFAKETGLTFPASGANRFADRVQLLRGEYQAPWLQWRSIQLATFYAKLQQDVTSRKKDAKLTLTGAELFADRGIQQELRPTLPATRPAADAFLPLGLDIARVRNGSVVVPRAERLSPLARSGLAELLGHWNESADIHALFPKSRVALQYHEPAPLRLESFDELSPFGKDKTHSLFVSHMTAAGNARRRPFVHNLAKLDAEQIIDGSWMPLFGQDEALRPFAEVFRQLPRAPFRTVEPAAAQLPSTPVVVRSYQEGNTTWVYAVNDSAWPMRLELDVRSGRNMRWEPLGSLRGATVQPMGSGLRFAAALEPYDVVAGRLEGGEAAVEAYRVTPHPDVEPWLRDRIREARVRVNALRTPQPMTTLKNPGFELPLQRGSIPHWTAAAGEGIRVELDTTHAHEGQTSLHLVSQGKLGQPAPVIWVRSEPLESPRTGRLSLLAWIRVDDPSRQPKLRLAVEGKWDGRPYYRRANVGAAEDRSPTKPLHTEWAPYRFPINDLPLAGLTDLRVGFDLMGEGDVWIDHVQVYDLWLEDHERDELLKNAASAELQLDGGQWTECNRFLESPWATFVRKFTNVGSERIATAPSSAGKGPPNKGPGDKTAPPQPPARQSFFNRVRESVPKWPLR